jgi:prepilin-type N-terminal cleavage/methylation domain-containing protein
MNKQHSGSKPTARAGNGFTLLELVIAMAVFVAVSGVSFSLFNQQQIASRRLQGQTALNVSLRNAVSQLQMDMVGAGSGYFQSANMPGWPVGVTIVNNMVPGVACNNGTAYGPACFDQLTIITAANPTQYPVINATGPAVGSGNCSDTSTGVAYGQAGTLNGTALTLAQTAAYFNNGDQLLFVKNVSTLPALISTAVLTSNATVSNGMVKFAFHITNSDGSNQLAYDPLDISACDGKYDPGLGCNNTTLAPPPYNRAIYQTFTNQFCSTDYIIKLAPIIYLVCAGPSTNTTNVAWCDQSANSPDIQDPKLVRIQYVNGAMAKNVVMEQVIGFRVGAALWNGQYSVNDDDSVSTAYNYQASTYCVGDPSCATGIAAPWNFSLIRAVRISLIGRTAPSNVDTEFENAFDQGHYQVQGIALVVNLRNESMNDTP